MVEAGPFDRSPHQGRLPPQVLSYRGTGPRRLLGARDDIARWPGAIFRGIGHAGCHRSHQGMKWLRRPQSELTTAAGDWIPACAGMTDVGVLPLFSYQGDENGVVCWHGRGVRRTARRPTPPQVPRGSGRHSAVAGCYFQRNDEGNSITTLERPYARAADFCGGFGPRYIL